MSIMDKQELHGNVVKATMRFIEDPSDITLRELNKAHFNRNYRKEEQT